jgi:hypothetical protein
MNALGLDVSMGGIFLGFAMGYSLMAARLRFAAREPTGGKGQTPTPLTLVTRYVIGMLGAGLLFLGLRFVLPGEASLFAELPFWGASSPYYTLGRFVRYGALGAWATAGAPYLFVRLGLAGVREEYDEYGLLQ